MRLATIEMPAIEARKAFVEYRHAVRERHDKEDEALMRCYRELARGKLIVNIFESMHKAGVNSKNLPRLAFARADEQHIFVNRTADGGATFRPDEQYKRNGWPRDRELVLARNSFPAIMPPEGQSWTSSLRARAIVPNIPPQFRPAHDLSNYHILWEADWQPIPRPRDPALLKHIGGPFYAVLAIWDVTPLEAAVLGVTRN